MYYICVSSLILTIIITKGLTLATFMIATISIIGMYTVGFVHG
jgi:hypothetical protein